MAENNQLSRRSLIPAAVFTIIPRHALGGPAYTAPSDKLNIAGVGVGGMGANYLKGCENENIVALADVDDQVAAKTFARYPKAKTYRDYRVMLANEKSIDAVVIGTPDHTHAVIAMNAIRLGKHVYCAKPMTRTIHEARAVTRAAREAKVATQMSVQSCASDAACRTVEWVQSGVVGPVTQVHVWSDRPVWPQGCARPSDAAKFPKSLDWDLWLGPAPVRPYHPIYHPFNFRGWYDFGTGALGDMACHTLHVIFKALDLGYPARACASTTFVMLPALRNDADRDWTRSKKAVFPETFPHSSIVTWEFPARGARPPVVLTWYDGGLKPPLVEGMDAEKPMRADGIFFVGEKGVIASGFTGGPSLPSAMLRKSFDPPLKTLPRSPGHYDEWIAACKGGQPANCNFEFGSLLTETALLGTIAQRTGRTLVWDSDNMRIPNDADANAFVNPPYRAGWSL